VTTSDNKTVAAADTDALGKTTKEPVVKAATGTGTTRKKKGGKSSVSTKKKAASVVITTSTTSDSNRSSNSHKQQKIVIIEACKQWNAFKTRANKILKAVGDKAIVQINQEKPGKGNFIVSIVGMDEPIISLIGMKRPFPALKALDMDVINEKVMSAL